MRRIIPYSLLLLPFIVGPIVYQIYFIQEPDLPFPYDTENRSVAIFGGGFESPSELITSHLIALFFTIFIILLIIECSLSNLSKKWLALPVFYFGGFYSLMAYEFIVFSVAKASDEQLHHGQRIAFDPSRHTLVSQGSGSWFVANYDMPVVFEQTPLGKDGYLAHRIFPNENCDSIRADNIERIIGKFSLQQLVHDGAVNNEYCIVSKSETPRGQTIYVSRKITPIDSIFGHKNKIDFTIRDWQDNEYTISAGTSLTLFPFPIPVLNCIPQDPPPN